MKFFNERMVPALFPGESGGITTSLSKIEYKMWFKKKNPIFFLQTRLHDSWYEAREKSMKYTKEKGLPVWEDITVWRDFRPPPILKVI
jgi:hypothetical protein